MWVRVGRANSGELARMMARKITLTEGGAHVRVLIWNLRTAALDCQSTTQVVDGVVERSASPPRAPLADIDVADTSRWCVTPCLSIYNCRHHAPFAKHTSVLDRASARLLTSGANQATRAPGPDLVPPQELLTSAAHPPHAAPRACISQHAVVPPVFPTLCPLSTHLDLPPPP